MVALLKPKFHWMPDGPNGKYVPVRFFYESEDHRGEDIAFAQRLDDAELMRRGEWPPGDEETLRSAE